MAKAPGADDPMPPGGPMAKAPGADEPVPMTRLVPMTDTVRYLEVLPPTHRKTKLQPSLGTG